MGDPLAKNKLINELIGLSYFLANKFIRRFPQYAEELRAIAVEHLVVTLNKIENGQALTKDNNVGAYINASTVYALLHWLRKQKKQTDRMVPVILDERSNENIFLDTLYTYNTALYNLLLDDIMNTDVFSEKEKLYIQLRLDGLEDYEISKVLKVKVERIAAFKHSLKKRLYDFL